MLDQDSDFLQRDCAARPVRATDPMVMALFMADCQQICLPRERARVQTRAPAVSTPLEE